MKTSESTTIEDDDPRAKQFRDAVRSGDTASLRAWLAAHEELAPAYVGGRSLLHVVADWPGHFPNAATAVELVVDAGADVNARYAGCQHNETPLHWAASSDDVAVLDALIDAGADLEADGAVIAGGTPLMDAVAFGQWRAARRLVERGAQTTLWQAAGLNLLDRVQSHFADAPPPTDEIHSAFWAACHGGALEAAQYLHQHGADPDWIPRWERLTPLDAARRSEFFDVLTWLHSIRARSADQVMGC